FSFLPARILRLTVRRPAGWSAHWSSGAACGVPGGASHRAQSSVISDTFRWMTRRPPPGPLLGKRWTRSRAPAVPDQVGGGERRGRGPFDKQRGGHQQQADAGHARGGGERGTWGQALAEQ